MSIVGRDEATGCVGAAVATAQVAPGIRVLHSMAGVGVVAAQAESELALGRAVLDFMASGCDGAEALSRSLDGLDSSQLQVGVVGCDGSSAAYTGSECQGAAGHAVGDGGCAQANMMATGSEWDAMLLAYQEASGSLPQRLLAGLRAGQTVGGDIRGVQGAALIVVTPLRGDRFGAWWWDQNLDLRVDDHDDPVTELERLLDASDAQNITAAALQRAEGDPAAALADLERAAELAPTDPNVNYLLALALIGLGQEAGAKAALVRAAVRNPRLRQRIALLPAPTAGIANALLRDGLDAG
jgi:uncharacterized Ntn-hydrolase superfamily protein